MREITLKGCKKCNTFHTGCVECEHVLADICEKMLECLIETIEYDGEIFREEFQLKIIDVIEKATGKPIKEVIK